MKPIITIAIFCILVACSSKKESRVIATIDGEEISSSAIDKAIEQRLYDYLFKIYDLRKNATEEYINRLLIERESKAACLSVDSFIKSYIEQRVTPQNIEDYALREHFTTGVPYVEDGIYHYTSIESERGQSELAKGLRTWLRQQLTDSLKIKYNVEITLKQPIRPRMILDSLQYHERGNVTSPIKFTEITDYNCSICRSMYCALEELYDEYSDKICFRYASISTESDIASRAVLAADRQEKLWQMRDAIMREEFFIDSIKAYKKAIDLELDMDAFNIDFADNGIISEINTQNKYLTSKGLYATPTFMINGHIISNGTDIRVLRKEIERAIAEIEN